MKLTNIPFIILQSASIDPYFLEEYIGGGLIADVRGRRYKIDELYLDDLNLENIKRISEAALFTI